MLLISNLRKKVKVRRNNHKGLNRWRNPQPDLQFKRTLKRTETSTVSDNITEHSAYLRTGQV